MKKCSGSVVHRVPGMAAMARGPCQDSGESQRAGGLVLVVLVVVTVLGWYEPLINSIFDGTLMGFIVI